MTTISGSLFVRDVCIDLSLLKAEYFRKYFGAHKIFLSLYLRDRNLIQVETSAVVVFQGK